MSNAISIKGLTKTFGDITAVDNLTLDIPKGSAFAFLGPNGAGKSTTLKILTSLIKPTSGEAHFFNINALEEPHEALLQIGAVVESAEFYPSLTPSETLDYFGRLRGMNSDKISRNSNKFLKLVGLDNWSDKKIGTFSRGMKQRLAIAQALLHEPPILLLDEPTFGLDPRGMVEIRNVFKDLTKEGKTIFFSSHLIGEIEEICDTLAIIDKGQVLFSDTMKNIMKKFKTDDLEEIYLKTITESVR
ncbi:MAG: ABC transporter ATP-binding protein [Thaumarchaeota archaeon]|jgi:ABC-2 type transport system ATP-binding protein|nr:ABC transporter ATP-binding protein [Nitrososphaerales archaeon]NSL73343.1 ABC transporter ATP-binding protein [Nitrososphaerota archaeon]NSL75433.1 ABC transporter ATP-binding protein [Nitrososphaerota archaeon]